MTSHDVVAALRKKLGTRQIGHAGTLDPMATGVLVVAVDEATKLVPYLTASDKAYEATVTLGVATDTLDADGRETARVPVPAAWQDALDGALAAERARTEQQPPLFSAIHTEGGRAHALARRGESPHLEPRPVRVHSIDVVATEADAVRLRLVVSKGYYVRGLARDLAERLGTVGHLTSLRRTRSGAFTLEGARALADVDAGALIPLEQAAARALPTVTLTLAGVAHARAGRAVPESELSSSSTGDHAWLAPDGQLVAIGSLEGGVGRVRRGFVPRRDSA
jgi:tRNA pseudouridine55 synthase